MAIDSTKIKLGPCKVTFDSGGASPIVFDMTKGGVELSYEETTRDVVIDQTGSTPQKKIITGRKAIITVPVADYDLDKLVKVIPGATLVSNGTNPTKKRLDVSANAVVDLITVAKKLKLELLSTGASANDNVIMPKATPSVKIGYKYDYDNELVTTVTFEGVPDATGILISFGDETA